MLSLSYIILRIQRLEGKQCRSDEVAHYEPPHQDLRCLQIQLFSSLVLKELNLFYSKYSETAAKDRCNGLKMVILQIMRND